VSQVVIPKPNAGKEVTVGDFSFSIVDESYLDLLSSWGMVEQIKVTGMARNVLIHQLRLVMRIQSWKGPIEYPDGSPVPCNMESKMAFFSQLPDVILEIAQQLARTDEDIEKN
jgi:hypothetical protein